MAKINILESNIFNRISAGEVVEKPASVVKELVENSLDSGATSIIIEIVQGGTKEIKVTDNGSGIDFDDLQKAFLPHATSKISKIDDLESISTLGFRGEALASIGSVANVVLQSKPKNSEFGGKIEVNGGEIGKPVEVGCTDGTFISVKNLFYNIPARAKFLKSNKTEEGNITSLIGKLILANPNIAFKYIVDGEVVYLTTGKDLLEGIYTVYGKETVTNIIPLEYKSHSLKISGYISKPSFTRSNRTYQTLMVNGRYVVNQLISTAVGNAYENYVMKGRFPFYVLNIEIPFEDVDVNVHPNKLEVKFKSSLNMFGIVMNAVAEVLLELNNVVDISLEDEIKPIQQTEKPQLAKLVGGHSFGSTAETNTEKDNQETYNTMQTVNIFKESIGTKIQPIKTLNSDNGIYYDILKRVSQMDNNIEEQTIKTEKQVQDNFVEVEGVSHTIKSKLIGTIFNTYIIIEKDDEMFLIDQHAGHERLLYDKFKTAYESGEVMKQDLLVPYIFDASIEECMLIDREISTIRDMGFDLDKFGNNTYKISSVPLILEKINLEDFVGDILKNLNKISSNNEVVKDFFATKACKAAVKGGQELSNNEVDSLLNQIVDNKTTLLCPHGRPVCVKIEKSQIEKMFKRKLWWNQKL